MEIKSENKKNTDTVNNDKDKVMIVFLEIIQNKTIYISAT